MKLQHLHDWELIYHLHQKIKQCFLAYSQHLTQAEYLDQFEEQYKSEREILTWMIREILKTGEYTLDGIAYYTRLPIDIIFNAAMGMQKETSLTLWIKIAELFLQVRNLD